MRVFTLLAVCLFVLTGATCIDKVTGTDPKTGTSTGGAVDVAGKVVSSLPFPFAGLIGAGISAIPGIWAAFRGRQWKNAALATAQGVQNVVGALDASHVQTAIQPSLIADTIKKSIDTAHDDHGVNQAMQNAISPTT